MNRTKKVLSMLLMVVLVISLFSGCGNKKTSTNTENEKSNTKVSDEKSKNNDTTSKKEEKQTEQKKEAKIDLGGRTIKIVTGNLNEDDPFNEKAADNENTDTRKKLQQDVEKKYNCKIEYVEYTQPWEKRPDEIKTSVLSGEPLADIARINLYWTAQLASGDFVLPFNDYIKYSKIPQYSLDAGIFKGKYYAMGTSEGGGDQGIFFNKRLMKEAGLENPTLVQKRGEWTFDKFLEYARKLKSTLPKDIYPISMEPGYFGLYIVGANGGYILDPKTSEVKFTDPVAIEALEFMQKVYQEGLVMPVPEDADGNKDYWGAPRNAFKQGKSVMTHGHVWEAQYGYNKDMEDEYGYVPFPCGPNVKKDMSNYHFAAFGGDGYVLLKGTKNPDAVFKIWNELQNFKNNTNAKFEEGLESVFPDEDSINALMWARQHVYNEKITNYQTADGSTTGDYFKACIKIAEDGESVRSTLESIKGEVQSKIQQITEGK